MQPAPVPAAVILIHKCVVVVVVQLPPRTSTLGSPRNISFRPGNPSSACPSSVLPTHKCCCTPYPNASGLRWKKKKEKPKADRLRQPMAPPCPEDEGANAERALLADAANPGSPPRSNIYKEKKSKIPSQPMRNDKLKTHLPICLVTAPPIAVVGQCAGVLSSRLPPFHMNCRRVRRLI